MNTRTSIQKALFSPLLFFYKKGLQLTPNCLLTRGPILLVYKSTRSLRTQLLQNKTYIFLKEHGYQVEIVWIASNSSKNITSLIKSFFSNQKRLHIISSPDVINKFSEASKCESVPKIWTQTKINAALEPFNDYCDILLGKAVKLAEQDYIEG